MYEIQESQYYSAVFVWWDSKTDKNYPFSTTLDMGGSAPIPENMKR